MHKTRFSKLQLGKETLKNLDAERLAAVKGGLRAMPDPTQHSFCELKCITYEIRECNTDTTVCP